MRILVNALVKMITGYIKNKMKPFVYDLNVGNDYQYHTNPENDSYLSGVLILPIEKLGIQIQRDNGSILRLKAIDFVISFDLKKRELNISKIHLEPDEDVGNCNGNYDDNRMMESTLYAYDKNSGSFRNVRESSIAGKHMINDSSEGGVWRQLKDSVSGWMSYGSSLMAGNNNEIESNRMNDDEVGDYDEVDNDGVDNDGVDRQINIMSSKIEDIIGSPRVVVKDFSLSHSIHSGEVTVIAHAAPFELFFDIPSEKIISDIENISVKVVGTENLFSANVKNLGFEFNTVKKNIQVRSKGVYVTISYALSETFELVEEFLCKFLHSNKRKTSFSFEINDVGFGLKVKKSYLMLKSQYIKITEDSFLGNLFTIGFKQYGRTNLEQTRKLDILSVQYVNYLNKHLKIKDVNFNLYGDLYNRLKLFIEPLTKEIDFIKHLIQKTQKIMSICMPLLSENKTGDRINKDEMGIENNDDLLFKMEDVTGIPINTHDCNRDYNYNKNEHNHYCDDIGDNNGFEFHFDENYFDLENNVMSDHYTRRKDNDTLIINCNVFKIYQWIYDWDKSTDNYVVWEFKDIQSSYEESVKFSLNIGNWIIEDHLQNSNWKTFLHFKENRDMDGFEERTDCHYEYRCVVLNTNFIEEKDKWNLSVFLNDLVLNIDEDTFNFIIQNICSQFGTDWLKGNHIKGNEPLDYWEDENDEFDYLGTERDDCGNDWDTLDEYNGDKDRLDFENDGFEFVNESNGTFNQIELNSFTIILSYRPKYINYGNLVNGKVSELFKLKNIRDLPLRFSDHIIINDISFNSVLMCWVEDVLNLNLNRILFSGGSLEVLYNIAVNTLNIIKMKKGERGTVRNLGKMATRDFLNLTSRSVLKVQNLLEKLTRKKKSSMEQRRSGFSESPSTMKEGLHSGWTSLKDRFGYMTSEEATMKSVIIQPFIGAAEMISKTLIGLENQLDANKKELRDKRYE